jgi:hypothetical protein
MGVDFTRHAVVLKVPAQLGDHRIDTLLVVAARIDVDDALQQAQHLRLRRRKMVKNCLLAGAQRFGHALMPASSITLEYSANCSLMCAANRAGSIT